MIKSISVLSLFVLLFLSACVSNEKIETKSEAPKVEEPVVEVGTAPILSEENVYGIYTADIKNLLEASPIGSEIYLKEGENGEWHLRIEKIFTAESFSTESAKYFEEKLIDEENAEVISGSSFPTPEILTI
jgi:hypothetical protein